MINVGMMVGRFQPLHNGHVDIINIMINENDFNIIFVTKHINIGEKYDFIKRSDMLRQKFGNDIVIKPTEDINVNDSRQWYLYILGKLSMTCDILNDNITWYMGDDINYLTHNNTKINLHFKKIKRESNISGTMVRKLISENKWNEVKRYVPNSTYEIIKPKSKLREVIYNDEI